MARWLKHLFTATPARRHFPPATLTAIQHAIAAGEQRHLGEICFVVEGALPWRAALAGQTPRQRAHELFGQLRVWDTHANSGVLLYLLLADHAIEIVADRGIAARVDPAQWQAICAGLRQRCTVGEFQAGAIAAVEQISDLLAAQIPANGRANPDELPDRPIVL